MYVALQASGDTWVRSFAHQLYSVCKWSAGPFLQEKIVIVTCYTLGCRFIRLVFGKCGVPLLSVQAAVCMAVKSRAALPKTLPSKVCSSMLHTDSNCTLTAGIMAPGKLDTLLRQLHLQTMTDYQRKALVATLAPLALLTCEQVCHTRASRKQIRVAPGQITQKLNPQFVHTLTHARIQRHKHCCHRLPCLSRLSLPAVSVSLQLRCCILVPPIRLLLDSPLLKLHWVPEIPWAGDRHWAGTVITTGTRPQVGCLSG